MSTNIMDAARQYANRPKDERFASPSLMVEDAIQDKVNAREVSYPLSTLRIAANPLGPDGNVLPGLALQSAKGVANFTNWSFSQLCRTVGAPAGYLGSLPAQLAADALNHGLMKQNGDTKVNILLRQNGEGTIPTVRAATSDSYGRVWDADLYGTLGRTLLNHSPEWQTPPTWSGEPAGAYRGDRDSFLILVNGGSIVEDPSLRTDGGHSGPSTAMYRGLMVRNSEVGGGAVSISRILFRYICGNHIIWDAMVEKVFRKRHVGNKVLSSTIREIASIAAAFSQQSASRDEALISSLISHEVGKTKDEVVEVLSESFGFTRRQAEAAYTSAEQKEGASPRSWWGIAQGATRVSQESGYQNDRLTMDKLASVMLAKAARMVTV